MTERKVGAQSQRSFMIIRALIEIPSEGDVPKTPGNGVITFFDSFEQMYLARRDIQANRIAVPRDYFGQQLYESVSLLNRTADQYQNINVFNSNIEKALTANPIRLLPNDFPKDLPPDASHWLLWYRPDISDLEKAKYLATQFLKYGVGPNDFFVYRNPVFLKSMPKHPHDHIFIKHREGWFRRSDTQTTFLMPFYDLDLEELQLDMDADWYWNQYINM